MPSAKERKAEAKRVASQAKLLASTSSRRAGRVTIYHVKPQKRHDKPVLGTGAKVTMQAPKGLSPEAAFMEMMPRGYSPIDWMRLFTPDMELWEPIVEEALYALEEGGTDG